ncbi:hypothetical protein [Microlunatus flavus]|uniref:hypothetical protein n=1 Tax=Microlunatus flavus TaxID=1036181 RepID=UPI00111415BB|nr:hypothetical protein [Microlunatus flavus]
MWWVLLFLAIAVGGALVLGRLLLGLWRKAGGLLEEADVLAVRAGELADLLAQVEVPALPVTAATHDGHGSEPSDDSGRPGTVESYDDRGATAPGKKEP